MGLQQIHVPLSASSLLSLSSLASLLSPLSVFASTGFRFISILASVVEESISCLLLHHLLLHGWMLQQMMIHGSFGMFVEEFPEQFKYQHNVESEASSS